MKKYTILFACALSQEQTVIKEEIKKLDFKNIDLKFLVTGVGNYNTIYSLKNYLSQNSIDFLVNIGVCGKSERSENDDFFQVARIKLQSNNKETISPIYFRFLNLKSILSSEKVITENEEMLGENFVDMESFAVDFVATKEQIPFIILKKPFDFVSLDSQKVDIKSMQDSLKKLDYKSLLENIVSYLEKNKKDEINIDFYKEYFSLTFAEAEIFKKLKNKYEALVKKDFKYFFDENKNLSKKEFMEKLDNN